jgi:hypothetical protein
MPCSLGLPAWKVGSGSRSFVLFIKRAGQLLDFLRSFTAYLSVLLASGPWMARRLGGLLDANYRHSSSRPNGAA